MTSVVWVSQPAPINPRTMIIPQKWGHKLFFLSRIFSRTPYFFRPRIITLFLMAMMISFKPGHVDSSYFIKARYFFQSAQLTSWNWRDSALRPQALNRVKTPIKIPSFSFLCHELFADTNLLLLSFVRYHPWWNAEICQKSWSYDINPKNNLKKFQIK